MFNYSKTLPSGLLSVAEAAKQYGVHPATIRRWIDRGLVPAYRVGERRLGIKASDLAKVVTPRAGGRDHAPSPDPPAVPQRLTPEEQERGLRALAEMRRMRQELAAEHGGAFTPEGWVLLNEAREERSRELLAGHSGDRPRVGDDVEE